MVAAATRGLLVASCFLLHDVLAYDLILGVLVSNTSDATFAQAVWSAIHDAQADGALSVLPLFAQTSANDTMTLQVLAALPSVLTAVVGPSTPAACRLSWPLLSLQGTPQWATGCTALPRAASMAYPLLTRVAPNDMFKVLAVELVTAQYSRRGAVAYVVPATSEWASIVLPSLVDVVPTSRWFLYDAQSATSLAAAVAAVHANASFTTLAFDRGWNDDDDMTITASSIATQAQRANLTLIGLALELDLLNHPPPLVSLLLSITMPKTPVANLSQSLVASYYYDATALACRAHRLGTNTSASALSVVGASGPITWTAAATRAPLFQLQALLPSSSAAIVVVVGAFALALNGSLVYTPTASSSSIAWPTSGGAAPTSTPAALPYGTSVLGGICISSACSLAFLLRMFLPPFWLVSLVFDGFDRQKEVDEQTFQVYSVQEKHAAKRRNAHVLVTQTLLDVVNLGLGLAAYFGFVIAVDDNIARIAFYSLALGCQIAFMPSLLSVRVPMILRYSQWAIAAAKPKTKVQDEFAFRPLGRTDNVPAVLCESDAMDDVVPHSSSLDGLHTTLTHVQQEHVEVANSLLRLWLEEVPLLGLNVFYIVSFPAVVAPVVLAVTFSTLLAVGFKLHLFNRLSELYFSQRGVLFDIAMARLESKQRRSSYN
ncbi:Aste57867_24336 [Aphanomyces stellatus]|uniref:Aste57867_24336 protein n=1 Tax=Aphanomyces stellatus TaxID=120398 RepID=A0A485LR94_9STRA|nr:hypothetical protein As57867_024261 [Aphanomyces stellatus]VFU00976.1 Aste57867_24336 [Aphanomyces stellatus]